MHVLIVEDDLELGRALQQVLQTEGFSSQWLRRAADAPQAVELADYACVLLDLSLPDGSGFDLLARWRRGGALTPVLLITARSGLDERLRGLDGGADDYLVKPFAMPELLSRMRAVQRRYAQQASELWRIGDLEISPGARTARVGGQALELSPREFNILLELAREPGRAVAKGALAQRLEPLGEALEFSALEVHMSNLRKKIGPERIHTLRGVGYRLERPE
ncbi:DNA-binding response regulator [Paucibacter aquatile]|uniref:DNA-binding response regulator n=1 Tax=Kinneretia aquatilis TaxID=2070761 RepID=A0A2N8KWM0_9BURK|nr:response regulator [Paucibacter aquatile]PND37856.1 DNA-binding response regulator [Paucibacter aquatile]